MLGLFDFTGHVVLVTGASRGIGAAIAAEFAKLGAHVFANHPSADSVHHADLISAWAELDGCSAKVFPIQADVSKSEDVAAMMQIIGDPAGRLDVLVNNAGISRDSTVRKMSNEDWDAVIRTNLTGTFNCCRAALPILKDEGRIINISSVMGHSAGRGNANYSASKAGILSLTRSLALELARRRITVNAICPGMVDTELSRGLPSEITRAFLEMTPLGRAADPKEIAYAAVFLASPAAAFVTGHAFDINGGMYLR